MSVFEPNSCFKPQSFEDVIGNGRTLYAFYDLAISPATFDIVHFLGIADDHRRRFGFENMHVVIPPGPKEGFRDDDVTPYDRENQRWRLQHVLIPCCCVFPTCQKVSILGSRQEARDFEAALVKDVFPVGYTVDAPVEGYRLNHLVKAVDLRGIRATSLARKIIGEWIALNGGQRKVVTITLRECSYETDRNSNLAAWGAFARGLDSNIFFPVVLRDTEAIYQSVPPELENLMIFSEPLWNIDLRTALYELSFMNLFVNNGPAALARLNSKSSSLTFKMITSTSQATTEEFFRSNGLEPGQQLLNVSRLHQFVWKDDNLENIQHNFDSMCKMLENSQAGI